MKAHTAERPSADEDAYLKKTIDDLVAEALRRCTRGGQGAIGRVAYLEAARDKALNLVSFGHTRGKPVACERFPRLVPANELRALADRIEGRGGTSLRADCGYGW